MSRVPNNQKFIIIAIRNIFSGNITTVIKRITEKAIQIPYKYAGAIIIAAFVFVSCIHNTKVPKITETPTRGDIRILVDESFKPIIDAELSAFTSLYENAKIEPIYLSEVDVVNSFMRDSARVMVTSRQLTDEQIKYLRDTLVVARTTSFAWDALALVVNKSNRDSLLSFDAVRDIFTGRITRWNQINPKSQNGEIRMIFDNGKSGNIRYFRERFNYSEPLSSNIYALNNNKEVIEFVEKNSDAIGVISVNWISDKDDSLMMSFSNRIKVVAVSQQYVDDGSYYRPQQGFIYNKSYPFVREIFFVSRETFTGLGSGFIQFSTAEAGQRIVLKSGLVPATMPIRLVQIKTE